MSTTGPRAAKAATLDKHSARTGLATQWRDRVEAARWDTIRIELDSFGCALTGPLLAPDEAADIAALYTDDSRFRAFDAQTGDELWTVKLAASAHATPITYQGKDGKQYVAVVATGGSFLESPITGDEVDVFALP